MTAPVVPGHEATAEPWRDALVLYKYANPGVIRNVFTGPWVRPDPDKDRVGDVGVYLHTSPLPTDLQQLLIIHITNGTISRTYAACRERIPRRGGG